ncbi:hypothetical protein CVT25_012751 [Psilocybe cyanescens]|uniref:Uncharacterized protein n=1 Tax=Psilocybe cyanescens TaxID=93625 RepID=A0A409W4Q8_PSICY|nr:hypothetical protein CVT25_012751 [Psilocybe cyanescens]
MLVHTKLFKLSAEILAGPGMMKTVPELLLKYREPGMTTSRGTRQLHLFAMQDGPILQPLTHLEPLRQQIEKRIADGQDDEPVAEEENGSEMMSQMTATPVHATSGCKRSASPHPPITVKRMREAPGTQVMRGLGTTFDRVVDVLEKAFPKSDLPLSPDRKFNAITQCQKIEKDWLDKGQIAKLVVILGKELYALISYQGAMEDEIIRKNVVHTLLGMELEVQEEEN